MKTKILKVKGDWQEVVNDCRATVAKPPIGKDPSATWKRKILIAEHDPIRDLEIKFQWKGIPYWVAMHWKTHIWRSRTTSQRNDRQERYDRTEAPQRAPVDFIGDANAQHLIDTERKRLCRQSSPETRKYAEDLKIAVRGVEPELGDVLAPNCVYRAGCPEMTPCGYYDALVAADPKIASANIAERYAAYNRIFYNLPRWDSEGQDDEG